MKKIINISLIALAALFSFSSCNDAEYGDPGVHAFFAESVSNTGVSGRVVSLADGPAQVELNVTLTDAVAEETVFRLVPDETVLATYNKEQSAGYEMFPEDYCDLGGDVVIPAGEYYATATVALDELPAEYTQNARALPLKIEQVSGPVPPTSTTSAYVIAIETVLVNDLAQYGGGTHLQAANFDGVFASGFTVEVKFQVSNTGNRNRDVFSNGKAVLFRFEDPQSAQGDVRAHSSVQFQGDGNYINPNQLVGFEVNQWQHLAYTWDGSTGLLYYNGALVGSKPISSSEVGNGEFPIASWFCGSGSGGGHGTADSWWSGCNILFTEARVWSVVRTADQIANNMSFVNANAAGLEGYWRINRLTYTDNGDGTHQFEDLTGKGHPLVSDKAFTWNNNISSRDQATPWVY